MLEKRLAELCLFVGSGARVNPKSLVFHDDDRAPTSTLLLLLGRSGCSLHHHPTEQHSALLLRATDAPPWLDAQMRGPTSKKMQLPRSVDLVDSKWPGEEQPAQPDFGYKWLWQK